MALKIERKQEIVAEVNAAANSAFAAVAADYRGLTVAEMTGLRAAARDSGVQLRVVRNTLARRALVGTGHEQLGEAFVGPTMLALSESADDPGVAARLMRHYVGEYQALEVKALSVGGTSPRARRSRRRGVAADARRGTGAVDERDDGVRWQAGAHALGGARQAGTYAGSRSRRQAGGGRRLRQRKGLPRAEPHGSGHGPLASRAFDRLGGRSRP